MRTSFVLNNALPRRKGRHKRYFLKGERIDTPQMVTLLKKAGIILEEKYKPNMLPADNYKGIKLGYAFGGLSIWAKDAIQTQELWQMLNEEDLVKSTCKNMPVELREDK